MNRKEEEKLCSLQCQRRRFYLETATPLATELIKLILLFCDWDPYHLSVDEKLDAEDVHGNTYAAIVKEIKTEQILVHFIGWRSNYDEWISIATSRLSELKCTTCSLLNDPTDKTTYYCLAENQNCRKHCYNNQTYTMIPTINSKNYCCHRRRCFVFLS